MGEDALQAESQAVSIDPATSEWPDVFTDGPFGELCEVVPCYCKIGVKDAAQVRELAALLPTSGHIELFPVMNTGLM